MYSNASNYGIESYLNGDNNKFYINNNKKNEIKETPYMEYANWEKTVSS